MARHLRHFSRTPLPYEVIKNNIEDSLHVVIQIDCRPGAGFVAEVLQIRAQPGVRWLHAPLPTALRATPRRGRTQVYREGTES